MTKKSQEEAEQLVKNYQLDAVESQVQAINKQMTEGFARTNEGIQTLLLKSETQVTPQQLTDNIAAVKSGFENAIKESEEKIGYKMASLEDKVKGNNRKVISLTGVTITVGTAVVVAAFLIILKGGNG